VRALPRCRSSTTPRALAAASAAFVRAEIMGASCSATAARDVNSNAIRLWEVNGDELNSGLHQSGNEMDITCQSIDLSNALHFPSLALEETHLLIGH
jgi:hypothetical protein